MINDYDYIVNKKRLFSAVYIVLCVFIFILNQKMLNEYNNAAIYTAFFLNISMVILVALNNSFDILFLFLFCLNYLLVPILIQHFTGSSYGLLETNGNSLYMPELLTDTFIYNIIIVALSLIIDFPKEEYALIQTEEHKLTNITIYFNSLVAMSFAIVAFPRLSMNITGERFDMLLPGHAWNQLAIVALLFNLPYLRKRVNVKIAYIFVIMWFLLNGERADITGLILGLVIYYLMYNKLKASKSNRKKKVLALIIIFVFAILLNYIVAVRNGNSSFNFRALINGILVTPTTADVGYLYNVSIDYIKRYGELNGEVLKANFLSIVPFANPYDFGSIISSAHYANPGGEPLLAEPIIDFGKLGLYLIAVMDFFLISLPPKFKSGFFKKEFLVILCLIPRIVWYGRSYASTSVLIFVPIMFMADYIINKIRI